MRLKVTYCILQISARYVCSVLKIFARVIVSKIRLLSDHLANQIAAGEVVERPASVVKELLENSLDAGATRVDVQVEGSGARLVRVVDNGEGMAEDDVLLCIERHATSKLGEERGLEVIETLGFRGEALPSIASVSRFILVSRPADQEAGTRAEIRYGKLHGVHEAGCAQGTIVEVRNLFGNVPVRKKFLKSARTELHHIEEVIRNQALAHVSTTFTLQVDGRTTLDLPGRSSLQERFYDIFRCHDHWLHIDMQDNDEGMQLQGYLLQPDTSSNKGNRLRILVNGRPVKDQMVRHAVVEGLQGFLMKGQGPVGVILLRTPTQLVDVNVHPAKHEIRFRRSNDVHRFIAAAIRSALGEYQDKVRSDLFTLPKQEEPSQLEKNTQVEKPARPKQEAAPASLFGRKQTFTAKQAVSNKLQSAEPEASFATEKTFSTEAMARIEPVAIDVDLAGLTIIGQLFDLYLLCEKEGKLILIDQHAAHERILYEELCRNYLERNIPRQSLMFPVTVELSPELAEMMEKRGEDIEKLGFQVQHFGETSWVIKSVPALVSHVEPADLLVDSLEILKSVKGGEVAKGITPSVQSLLSTMACKAAVKSGNRLEPREMIELLSTMQDSDFFSHCPHGRPVIKTFVKREIEQWFRRT